MSALLATLGFGFLLGLQHATDADHVVAVSAIVARSRRFSGAWQLGAYWGIGHTVTIFIVGAAIVLFKVVIPPRLETAFELAVGAMLVILGTLNILGRGLGPSGLTHHAHPHDHDDPDHGHQFLDSQESGHSHEHAHLRFGGDSPASAWRSAIVGLVHGLAGSASVALLVLSSIPSPKAALGYLAVFGAGTLAGMLTLSALMALCLAALSRCWKSATLVLRLATGLLSVLCGLWVIVNQT